MLTAYAVSACAVWVLCFAGFVWNVRRVPRMEDELGEIRAPEGAWPRLSVIVPARNEGEHIESALVSLLTQDYPNLEVVAVDDRSTDATGAILGRLASSEPRLRAVHIETLPAGWLGKVHAMYRASQVVTGEWLLFTDADVHYAPGALRRAIVYARSCGVDHLALMPRFVLDKFLLSVAVRTFGLLLFLMARAGTVNAPGSRTPFGVGAFNLVRADVFARTPGFEWLRLEPGDDFGLGMMIRDVGGRTRLAFAERDLSIAWYGSVRAMFAGLEKNTFGPGAHYSVWRLAIATLALGALTAGPAVAGVCGLVTGSSVLLGAAATAFVAHVVASFALVREQRSEVVSLLCLPIGMLMFIAMVLRSSVKCLRNGGIDWRGTHYSIEELRAGQRVKF